MILPGRVPPERLGTATRRIGTPQHFRWMGWVVRATLVLNVFDALLTLIWVYGGRATEANPAMEYLVHNHPFLFVVVKFALVFAGSWLLWHYRKRPLSVVAIFTVFLAYYGVLIYHLSSMNVRMFRRFFD